MSGKIPENILEDVLARVNIVEVISAYIPVKRAGRNFKANCPFHHEKTPSFMVSPDRQIYHCFGCGESGNAFKFLMRYERLEFPEAVEILAKKAGVILPENKESSSPVTSISSQVYKINELALSFYEHNFNSPAGLLAKKYLFGRGIKEETIKLFKLGFALEKWDALLSCLRAKNINLANLEKAGLVLAKESGGYYDRFRNRVIFPIFDVRSRPLGFGARVLDKSLPKYVNSPETPVYIKGNHLYGLNLSKDAIRQDDFVVVVEGYLDFIIPYQEGLQNIVASLGTALTQEQVRLLKRYTHNVVMVYDGDAAGQMATLRTLDIFIAEGVDVKVVALPEGTDPDSFVRKNGIENFKAKVNAALNLFDYKLRILKTRHNPEEIEGKAKISSEMLVTIRKFNNAVLRSEYIKRLSEDLHVEEMALLQELNKIKGDSTIDNAQTARAININPAEKLLIKLMLEEVELINYIKQHLQPADFQDKITTRIVSTMFDLAKEGKNIDAGVLLNHIGEEDISRVVCETAFLPEVSAQHKEKMVDDCIQRLKKDKIKSRKQLLHEQIKAAQHLGDEEQLNKLMREFHFLIKEGDKKK